MVFTHEWKQPLDTPLPFFFSLFVELFPFALCHRCTALNKKSPDRKPGLEGTLVSQLGLDQPHWRERCKSADICNAFLRFHFRHCNRLGWKLKDRCFLTFQDKCEQNRLPIGEF